MDFNIIFHLILNTNFCTPNILFRAIFSSTDKVQFLLGNDVQFVFVFFPYVEASRGEVSSFLKWKKNCFIQVEKCSSDQRQRVRFGPILYFKGQLFLKEQLHTFGMCSFVRPSVCTAYTVALNINVKYSLKIKFRNNLLL